VIQFLAAVVVVVVKRQRMKKYFNNIFWIFTTNEILPEIQSGTISGKFTGNTTQNRQRQKKSGKYKPAIPGEAYFCLNFQRTAKWTLKHRSFSGFSESGKKNRQFFAIYIKEL